MLSINMEGEQTTIKKLHPKLDWHFFHWGRSPEGDWKIIFSVTTALVLCSITLSVFIFIKIDKGEIFLAEKTNENTEERLDLDKLKQAVFHYENKALEFERIQNSKPSYIDPSL